MEEPAHAGDLAGQHVQGEQHRRHQQPVQVQQAQHAPDQFFARGGWRVNAMVPVFMSLLAAEL